MHSFTIRADDAEIRLDRWFKRHYPNLPTAQVQKACRKGLIRLDGKKADAADRIQAGQEISVKFLDLGTVADLPKPILGANQISETQEWVLFKNREIICINKPAGIAVQGGSKLTDHLDARLAALQYDAKEIPKLVHRLDKDTSGVLVLARSTASASAYAKLFQGKSIEKTYLAITVGVPIPHAGEIESRMEKSGGAYEKMVDSDEGKRAVTAYRVLDYMHDKLALVELMPITGRTHQLRLHMQQMGCPILGDGKYGGKDAFIEGMELSRQLHLHAWNIVIPSKDIAVSAPLPAHMLQSMKELGLRL